MKIQKSSEDYLETMLILKEEKGYIRSIDVAAYLNVTKPSVSYATKRLREHGYIKMADDGLITLTETGMEIAKRMYDRHKLLSDFFIYMGVNEETAKEDACKIEHDLSAETFSVIEKYWNKINNTKE